MEDAHKCFLSCGWSISIVKKDTSVHEANCLIPFLEIIQLKCEPILYCYVSRNQIKLMNKNEVFGIVLVLEHNVQI
jgi:hypothetical protein